MTHETAYSANTKAMPSIGRPRIHAKAATSPYTRNCKKYKAYAKDAPESVGCFNTIFTEVLKGLAKPKSSSGAHARPIIATKTLTNSENRTLREFGIGPEWSNSYCHRWKSSIVGVGSCRLFRMVEFISAA
jgi:hypothetical protein